MANECISHGTNEDNPMVSIGIHIDSIYHGVNEMLIQTPSDETVSRKP